jgi:cell surface protein SprA
MNIASMSPNPIIGQNYITDIRNTQTLPNGEVTDSRWIQFKIPVTQPEYNRNISDFRSIVL